MHALHIYIYIDIVIGAALKKKCTEHSKGDKIVVLKFPPSTVSFALIFSTILRYSVIGLSGHYHRYPSVR